MVNNRMRSLLAFALPHYCVLCGLQSDQDAALCQACQGDLLPNLAPCGRCGLPLHQFPDTADQHRVCGRCQATPPPFDHVVAPWLYDEQVAHLVHRWKFNKERSLTTLFAHLWLEAAGPPKAGPPQAGSRQAVDIVAPVPLHWARRWQRGYNQAALLAIALHRAAGGQSQLDLNLLSRIRPTNAQATMGADERRHNLVGAFTARNACDNLRVALVDDVMTTGATATEVARVLKNAGAREVQVWCLARTPGPGA